MLSKAHLTSHSRMSGSRWVITPLWLSGSWRSFLYSSSVYSCHLFLISSASVRSQPDIKSLSKELGGASLCWTQPHQSPSVGWNVVFLIGRREYSDWKIWKKVFWGSRDQNSGKKSQLRVRESWRREGLCLWAHPLRDGLETQMKQKLWFLSLPSVPLFYKNFMSLGTG